MAVSRKPNKYGIGTSEIFKLFFKCQCRVVYIRSTNLVITVPSWGLSPGLNWMAGYQGSNPNMAARRHAPKGKHPESGGARREITCWHQAEESDAEGGGFLRLMSASDLPTRTTRLAGVFLLYRTYLWNKQQVMSINLTTWSTMQYHVVVDHVVFNVIHSQVRYKLRYHA